MDDRDIVSLYWQRDESALAETECKYGTFCLGIAMNLLSDGEDAEECVNEALLQAWNRIPPQRPEKLGAWLGRVVRNISISLWRKNHRMKRYNGIEEVLEELEDSIPAPAMVEHEVEGAELGGVISKWLTLLPRQDRVLFVRRYWYGLSLGELEEESGLSPSKLAQKMYRLRISLRKHLEKEGFFYEKSGQPNSI